MANQSNLGYACKLIRTKMINITESVRVVEHVEDEVDYLRLAIFNYVKVTQGKKVKGSIKFDLL